MSVALTIIGAYLFAMAVLRAQKGSVDASFFAVAAWVVGSVSPFINFERTADALLSSAGIAGLSCLGVRSGKWLGHRNSHG